MPCRCFAHDIDLDTQYEILSLFCDKDGVQVTHAKVMTFNMFKEASKVNLMCKSLLYIEVAFDFVCVI